MSDKDREYEEFLRLFEKRTSDRGGYIYTKARTKTLPCESSDVSKNTVFRKSRAAVESIGAAKSNTAKIGIFPETAGSKKRQTTATDNCGWICLGNDITYHCYCCNM